jgi:hypothetical protein
VIFEPHRTGFEEDKNFNPVPGTIVAGRYEVAEMLGQVLIHHSSIPTHYIAAGRRRFPPLGNVWI